MLALDIATSSGIVWDIKNTIHIQTITGDPLFQLDRIEQILESQKIIYSELSDSFNTPNPKTTMQLVMRQGFIHYYIMRNPKNTIKLVQPRIWRSYLGIKNNKTGTKTLQTDIKEYIDITLNVDEVDALGLWLCGKQKQIDYLKKFTFIKHKKLNQDKSEDRQIRWL